MITIEKTGWLYESHIGSRERPNPRGRTAFVTLMRHALGLCNAKGIDYRDKFGNRVLKKTWNGDQPTYLAESFSMGELGAAIVGTRFRDFMNPDSKGSLDRLRAHNQLASAFGDTRALFEATGVGVDVSAFADINAWTGVVGGLIERKLLEGFENPEFIGDQLMPTEPTKVAEGQKVIGVSRIGDMAQERQPGQPHARALVGERYVTLAKTRENALAADVTKEAAYFDLTGQVLDMALATGEWIGYRREIDMLAAFIGVTTGSTGRYKFTYGGTAYNTYSASQTIGKSTLVNSQANPLLDWQSLQSSWLLFMRMNDPETNTRIGIIPDSVVVNPAKLAVATLIQQASGVQRRTGYASGAAASQSAATELNVMDGGQNPAASFGIARILFSPLLEMLCTNSASDPIAPGLGLSQSDADKRWWHFQGKRRPPFKYMQNWPLTVEQAPPNTYDMLDKGIVASIFANERGMPSVWSPWSVVQNT